MTAVTSAVLFRSESKGSGFYANESPLMNFYPQYKSAFFLVNLKVQVKHLKVSHRKVAGGSW